MQHTLTVQEARVVGALLEKAITTPDQYPLSLNALTLACNQKTNREPLMQLAESEVQATLDALAKKHLVLEKGGFGARVPKYAHRFCNTEFGALRLSAQELAVICVLLLRGPQTPGELRTRTQRLCQFTDVDEIEAVLDGLVTREDGPFVVRLARVPGKRESRYAHLFCGPVDPGVEAAVAEFGEPTRHADATRIAALESAVDSLRDELAELRELLDALTR